MLSRGRVLWRWVREIDRPKGKFSLGWSIFVDLCVSLLYYTLTSRFRDLLLLTDCCSLHEIVCKLLYYIRYSYLDLRLLLSALWFHIYPGSGDLASPHPYIHAQVL
jgi:hypothetical protein